MDGRPSIFPFAIFAALSFTIPYALTGIFLGPEFPSIIGGLFGLTLVTIATKNKFLIPNDSWDLGLLNIWSEFKCQVSLKNGVNEKLLLMKLFLYSMALLVFKKFLPLKSFLVLLHSI